MVFVLYFSCLTVYVLYFNCYIDICIFTVLTVFVLRLLYFYFCRDLFVNLDLAVIVTHVSLSR